MSIVLYSGIHIFKPGKLLGELCRIPAVAVFTRYTVVRVSIVFDLQVLRVPLELALVEKAEISQIHPFR